MWQDVRPEDIRSITDILQADGGRSVVSGGLLDEFEAGMAHLAGGTYGVATNNGTAALYAALWAAGVGPDDEVLLSDYGFHAQAAAVLALGASVAVFDCDADTLAPSVAEVRSKRNKRTKAVLLHCPWGVPPALDAMRAAVADLPLIVDASHAHGATHRGKGLAAFADVVCYSCGVRKLITGGELGCAVTSDAALRERMIILGHVNRVPKALKSSVWHGNAVGLKLRPHRLALALAVPQLHRFADKKRRLAASGERIEAAFAGSGFKLQASPDAERVYWKVVVRPTGRLALVPRSRLVAALRAAGIMAEADPYATPLQRQPIFDWPGHRARLIASDCPRAAEAGATGIALPVPVDLEGAYPDDMEAALERALAIPH